MKEYRFLIDGRWLESSKKIEVKNPYNNETVGVVNAALEDALEEAVVSSQKAFEVTRKLPVYKRAEILGKIADGIKSRAEEIARIITVEAGKPIKDSRIEVSRAMNTFEIAKEEAKRVNGEVIPLDLMSGSENRLGIVRRFPIGPILGVTPFNFPLNLVCHKVAPAIASGNTIILKPASKTPITAIMLGEIVTDAGFPPGGLNIIPCSGKAAERLVLDERIKKFTFTGSAQVGLRLKNKAGMKKVTLELGGNAGVIIHKDTDIDLASRRCTTGAFSFAGQICISVQRIYVHKDVYKNFIEKFIANVKGLKTGDPLDEGTDIGPMIDNDAIKRTEEWVKEAVRDGAKVLTGGEGSNPFFEPTVLTDVKPSMKVCSEEVFAPVVTVSRYEDFTEAVKSINDSKYGLQAGIFTNDVKNIFLAYNELEVGGVIVNDIPTYRIDHMPYGGVKLSGCGREGIRYAIDEMTEIKLLALNLM
ncbi:MAG: aldehyde dehydrogenase [Deltaproteobacteria bacterium GWC2_42_11]|nr:MAG: aldehyde dehydrogenase [Deltaproteobacteria bacterium GWC2_42_11]HBO85010.1 aldehyde dehydrogenase [Deltaproteobacteria bacterium]